MAWILMAIGLVLVVEGLVYALAPHLVEELLEMMRAIPVETRRQVGFLVFALGLAMVWGANLLMQAFGA